MSFLEKLKRKKHPAQILLADDAKLSLNKIKSELCNHGYENIKTYDEGKSLFDDYINLQLDLVPNNIIIVTDIEMPEMGGYELCEKVKSTSPNTKVIILSSLISEDVAMMCENCKSDKFILKRDYSDLIKTIDEFLGI